MSYQPEALQRIHRVALLPITDRPFYSDTADKMLLMVAAHESHLGRYLQQQGGPALGVYGIEPDTMEDNYHNYLLVPSRVKLRQQIACICGVDGPDLGAPKHNPIYGAIHARLKIWRADALIPHPQDLEGMAFYLKMFYNSGKGKATIAKYLGDYHRLVARNV